MAEGRMLKKSICRSDDIDQLSWFEEVLYYRLIVNCDDYGLYEGRPKIIRGSLFPLKDSITLEQIEGAINKLVTVGLVRAYEVQGRPYLQLPTWKKHQRLRSTKPIYPVPDDIGDPENSPRVAATCGESRPEVEVEAEAEAEAEREPYVCTELHDCSTVPADNAVPRGDPADVPALLLNDGTEWLPERSDVSSWVNLFPAVDITRELGRMREWCKSNPKRRKTAKGIRRFVVNWLDAEQNRPRRNLQSARSNDIRGADAYFTMAKESQTQ